MNRVAEGSGVMFAVVGKAARIFANYRAGTAFEREVIPNIAGATKNWWTYVEADIRYKGALLTWRSIPDVIIAKVGTSPGVIIEMKNWAAGTPVHLGRQLLAQLAYAEQNGYKYRLILSPNTTVTKNLYDEVIRIGGTVEVYHSDTRKFTYYIR